MSIESKPKRGLLFDIGELLSFLLSTRACLVAASSPYDLA